MNLLEHIVIFAQINIPERRLDIPNATPDPTTTGEIVQIALGLLGSIALLIIVLAGVKYTLSRGSPDETAKARNAIIYASVGLVLALLSFGIVSFVIGRV